MKHSFSHIIFEYEITADIFWEIILIFPYCCGFICICHSREGRATLVRSPPQDQSTDPPAKSSAEWGLWAMLAYSIFPQLHDFHAHGFTVVPYRKPLAGKKCIFPSQNGHFGHRCCNNWKAWLEGIWAKFSTTELNLLASEKYLDKEGLPSRRAWHPESLRQNPFFTTPLQ